MIRVGVIGCGFQGRLHVEFLQLMNGVEVVAVCDIDKEKAMEVARKFNVPHWFDNFRMMLDDLDFDLVTVCTMPIHHAEMTIAALERGADVLCEKPLAMNAQEGALMVEAARRTGRKLAVGFNMRFTPNARAIVEYVGRGKLGRPVYTRAWAKASQIPWWGEHYRREVSGGGALAATAVHFLDLALYFAGFPEPETVSASMAQIFPRKRGNTAPSPEAITRYTAEDIFSAHIRFHGGFWISLEGSWVDNQPSVNGLASWNYSLDAVGESGQVWFDPLVIRGENELGEIIDEIQPGTESDVSFPPSVNALLVDVVSSIREDRPPLVTGEQALVVQKIVDGIYESAQSGTEYLFKT